MFCCRSLGDGAGEGKCICSARQRQRADERQAEAYDGPWRASEWLRVGVGWLRGVAGGWAGAIGRRCVTAVTVEQKRGSVVAAVSADVPRPLRDHGATQIQILPPAIPSGPCLTNPCLAPDLVTHSTFTAASVRAVKAVGRTTRGRARSMHTAAEASRQQLWGEGAKPPCAAHSACRPSPGAHGPGSRSDL